MPGKGKKRSFGFHPHRCLFLLLLIAVILQLSFLPRCYVNPDEGAHLMDARLLLEGYRPYVDYESRLPLYTFILAGFIKLLGNNYLLIRCMPVLFTLLTSLFLYLLAREIFDRSCALLAVAIYLFIPVNLFNSVVIQTEPVALFFTVASFYFLICSITHSDSPQFCSGSLAIFLAGAFGAMAYYVRISSLYLPLLFCVIIYFFPSISKKQRWQYMVRYSAGYLFVVCLMMLVFSFWLPLTKILTSKINPLDSVLFHLLNLFGKLPSTEKSVTGTGIQFLQQDFYGLMSAWEIGLLSTLFIFVSALYIFATRKYREFKTIPVLVWGIILILLYIYQSLFHGFFIQYMLEILPPFILMAAFVLYHFVISQNKKVALSLLLFYGLFVVIFKLLYSYSPHLYIDLAVISFFAALILWRLFNEKRPDIRIISSFFLISICTGFSYFLLLKISLPLFSMLMTFILIYFLLSIFVKRQGSFIIADGRRFVFLLLLILSVFVSAFYSGRFLGPQNVGFWSPKAIKQVVKLIGNNSTNEDVVLSGGMIWTFQSGLKPFINVSHPTLFLMKTITDFQENFDREKPKFIILDSYTQKKFILYWNYIVSQLPKYKQIEQIIDKKCTIEVYQRIPDIM